MKITLALGAVLAALATTASVAPDQTRAFIRHGGDANMDPDHDGWLSRAEALAAAERMFAELDSNSDARLTREDHPRMNEDVDVRVDSAGDQHGENCTTNVEPPEATGGGERRVTVICRSDNETTETETEENGARVIERHVTVIRGGHGEHANAPMPPMPPHPPMAMMLFAHSEEADLNGDGALSREEFSAQHLRFFDASDVNGDGRVRLPARHRAAQAPEPPIPPTAPAPPPPRRR